MSKLPWWLGVWLTKPLTRARTLQTLRALNKFVRVIAWILRGYWRVRFVFPQLSDEQQARAVEVWARGMLAIIGIEVRVKATLVAGRIAYQAAD